MSHLGDAALIAGTLGTKNQQINTNQMNSKCNLLPSVSCRLSHLNDNVDPGNEIAQNVDFELALQFWCNDEEVVVVQVMDGAY